MYCISCGVKLGDTQTACPLCGTKVYHPDFPVSEEHPLYPKNKYPIPQANSKVWNGILIMLTLLSMVVCGLADYHSNDSLDWLGYAIGGLIVGYIALALPLWFRHPNPVIFVPCNFASATLYVLYVCIATGGDWFLPFALPLAVILCLVVSALTTLLHYLKRGKLYVWGGFLVAIGCIILLTEWLLHVNFALRFMGWSIYPLAFFGALGLILIYLAINTSAREAMTRKLFF